ncbi:MULTISPECIES: RagB/SusD family nutrient uptake outer membrane protein [unclassified Sphingobacterium]|uniref:RagB/SusD family nutrient uptake outer membrane protein n=1 Tax=unclassified Sphingobacterium TaxID=2609468 RepID=UPI00265D4FDF|nr:MULTISPECIES: RagB/SusD family nutrient uptake outer membrane protein [unclassified Sphingobacterium]WKK59377.1 RagB/SusD family nutrient uptake outer membrane protein [Sphingobacterium sp. BN32]
MKRKTLSYTLGLLLSISLYSCSEDYLIKYPLDSPSTETFISNEQELNMAITGAYNALYQAPKATPMPFPLTIDYASDIGWERNTNALQILGLGNADANNEFTSDFWNLLYVGIQRCNTILDKVEGLNGVVPAETLNSRISEVRFLRAYYYFFLNELFGGVPLLTTTISLADSKNVTRESKEAVNDFIMSEIDAIVGSLPTTATGNNLGRATRGAALALKSRSALFNKKYQEAADAAKAVMELNQYQLHNNFEQLFKYAGESSKEIIWAIQYKRGLATHGISSQFYSRLMQGFSNKIPVQSLVDSYECIDGLNIDKSPLFDPNKPFKNRDPRLTQTVVLPQTLSLGVIFETHPDSTMTWDYREATPKRIANTDATNAFATFSGYLWRKYADPADFIDRSNSELNAILFRYAEVLLNYVEAKTELNQIDNSVYEAINQVRQRPSVGMPAISAGKSQAQMRSIVRKERKYELAAEGLRLFDIRRWNIAHQVMPGDLLGRIRTGWLSNAPTIDENGTPNYSQVANRAQMRVIEKRNFNAERDYVWPIPRIETETNPNLTQNKNY